MWGCERIPSRVKVFERGNAEIRFEDTSQRAEASSAGLFFLDRLGGDYLTIAAVLLSCAICLVLHWVASVRNSQHNCCKQVAVFP